MPPELSAPPANQAPEFSDPNAAPPPPQESWSKGFVKDDGGFDLSKFEKAPDDLKPLGKELGLYKSIDDLLKSHKELRGLASKKGLFDPLDPKASDAEKAERTALLRKANGAPEKPEEYGIKRPDAIPEAYWDKEWAATAQKIFHEEGASPGLAKRLMEEGMKRTATNLENHKKEQAAILEEQDRVIREVLVKEGFDYPKGLEDAQRAARKFGLDPESPFLKNASIFMAMSRAGRLLREDKLVTGATDPLGPIENITPEKAWEMSKDLTSNKKNPYWSAFWNKDENGKVISHPDHDKALRRHNELVAKAATLRQKRGR